MLRLMMCCDVCGDCGLVGRWRVVLKGGKGTTLVFGAGMGAGRFPASVGIPGECECGCYSCYRCSYPRRSGGEERAGGEVEVEGRRLGQLAGPQLRWCLLSPRTGSQLGREFQVRGGVSVRGPR